MENNLETKTKKYITSLLTSTPLVVTLQQLSKDYANTIGERIPYQRLGYNSLEHFLRSIPDTVNVRGSGPTAEIIPVVSQKSAHVFNLVTNQRVTKPRSRRQCSSQRRRMHYAPPRMCVRSISENLKPTLATKKIFYPQVNSTSTTTASSSSNYSSKTFEHQNNNERTGELHTKNEVTSTTSRPKMYLPDKPARIETLVETRKQDRKLDDRLTLVSKQKTEDKTDKNTDVESTKCTTNVKNLLKKLTPDKNKLCTEQLESNVPYVVRSNLKNLISQCPKGIWCAEVPEKYRKMFRQELNYQELGFRSLIDLCVCLSSIFHYVRPSTEDFKLYDRSRPLPDCAETEFTFASYNVNNVRSLDLEPGALPNIDWADINMFLPKDIFKPGEEIPRSFIPIEMADYELDIDIVVGEIYDLSKFWIYFQDSLLDTLMDNMQEFYKDNALEYQIPGHLMKEGLYCVQIIFGEYHRALIVDVMPELEDTIRVIFIDYGTMTKVPMKGACFLHKNFAYLPAQAIRCRLANIFPLEEGLPWSREASNAFRRMVANRDMSVKITHVNWEDQFLEVYLADVTDENNIFYINDKLVEEGFAQHPNKDRKQAIVDPIYTPIVKYIHLFPTFLELEHGLAPSTAEMGILNDCEVPINFCYPQYFYVDYSFEEEIIKHAEKFHEKNCMKGKQRAPIRYYDLDQFRSQVPDLSIFGELESEITAFLNRPEKQAPTGSSDEDFVDVDEEEFHARLDVMTEKFKYLSTKEEETVSVLKEDLLMTEDIMKDINNLCNYEESKESQKENIQNKFDVSEEGYHLLEEDYCVQQKDRFQEENHCFQEEDHHLKEEDHHLKEEDHRLKEEDHHLQEEDYHLQEEDYRLQDEDYCFQEGDYRFQEEDYYLQEQAWDLCTIEEARESVESKNSLGYEDSDYKEMFYSNHLLSKLTFERDCPGEGESGSSNSLQSEHSPVAKSSDCDLKQPDIWLRPINFAFLSKRPNLDHILTNNEDFVPEPTNHVSNKTSCGDEGKTYKNDLHNSSNSTFGGSNNNETVVKTRKCVSTNPFLEDDTTTEDISTDLPAGMKLNPNNPFLTFLSKKSEKGSSESSEGSSTSTTYDSPIIPTHSWSNFDDLSPETISLLGKSLSNSSSCGSPRKMDCANNCSIATQTVQEESKVLPPSQSGPPPYFGHQPTGPYNYQSWSSTFANPYYSVRFANYPSYSYNPAYGAMNSYRPPRPPGFPPPPGFAPIVSNSVVPAYPSGMQQGPPYYPPRPLPYYGAGALPQQNPAIQFSGTSRTTSLSAVSLSVVSENKDFYDVYNEHLRLQADSSNQGGSH